MKIEVKGKELEVEELAAGVAVRETVSGTKYYYIRCNVLGTWDFRHQQAFDGLLKRFGSIEEIGKNVISNAGKKANSAPKTRSKRKVRKDTPTARQIDYTDDSESRSEEFKVTYWSRNKPGTWIEVDHE